MRRFHITVNPFISKDPYCNARQWYAYTQLYTAPDIVDIHSVGCPSDRTKFPYGSLLYRDAVSELGGPRPIPYVRDLIAWSDERRWFYDCRDPWVGTINNDTIVMPSFYDRLNEIKDHNVVVIRVWDIPYIPPDYDATTVLAAAKRRHIAESVDGLLLSKEAHEIFVGDFPDYLFAEEWDRGLLTWIRRHKKDGIKPLIIDGGECLHVAHGRPWINDPTDVCVEYNLRLLKEFENG